MSAIFSAFGIDWRLLIINTVNFALMLAVLTYFLYKPLMRMLDERREKITKGVRDAAQVEVTLQEIEGSRAAQLAEAGRQADEILLNARAAAANRERELIAAGEANAARIVAEAEAAAREEKARVLEESKKEVARLIVLGLEKTSAS
ncbi:MAG: F0F1 ATP synthase subunit B [Minisyncoccia bacterium]